MPGQLVGCSEDLRACTYCRRVVLSFLQQSDAAGGVGTRRPPPPCPRLEFSSLDLLLFCFFFSFVRRCPRWRERVVRRGRRRRGRRRGGVGGVASVGVGGGDGLGGVGGAGVAAAGAETARVGQFPGGAFRAEPWTAAAGGGRGRRRWRAAGTRPRRPRGGSTLG